MMKKTGFWFAIAVGIATACFISAKSHASTPYPDAPGERFSVEVTGTGPDVLLIPGLACSRAVWDGTAAHLKGHYRLHIINIAGFAGEGAGANANGEVVAPTVDAIDSYIKKQHLHPIVIGHSLGGTMGLMLAKKYPEDIAKLIIVDALPYAAVIFSPVATVETIKPQASLIKAQFEGMTDEAFQSQEPGSLARMVSAAKDLPKLVMWRSQSNRHTFAQAFFDDLVTDLRPDLASITTPSTLLIPVSEQDGQDAVTISAFYKGQYANMPNLKLIEINNSRHFVMLDQPDAFYSAIDTSLK